MHKTLLYATAFSSGAALIDIIEIALEVAKNSLHLPASRPSGKGTFISVAWLVEFALRLASCPDEVRAWAGANLTQGIEWVLETPALARAARFLVLAVDDYLSSQPLSERALYRGWVWE